MIGDVLVRIGADISDYKRNLNVAAKDLEVFGKQAQRIGDDMYNIGKKATIAATPVYALGAAIGTMGLGRAMAAERVGIMFETIYDNATDAEKAMAGVLDLVKGTRYGLNEIADPFARLKSTGVDDATALTAMLANMNLASMKGDSSMVQRLTDLQQAALAMGKFDGSMINRFAEAFVDVPVLVGNALNMTRDEARDFLSNGAYDVEEIMNIISDGILNGSEGIAGSTKAMGGMIDAEGNTLAGKWANLKAAMARAGEKVWTESGAFDGLKDALSALTDMFDSSAGAFVPAATAIANAMANVVNMIRKGVEWFSALNPSTQSFIANLLVMAVTFGPVLMVVGALVKGLGGLIGNFRFLISPVGVIIGLIAALGGIFAYANSNGLSFGEALSSIFRDIGEKGPEVIQGFIKSITDNLPKILETGKEILTGIIEGIIIALPFLVEGAMAIISMLAEAFITMLPVIQEIGVELLTTIINGIVEALPNLTGAAIDLIGTLISAVVDLLPEIITAGIEILQSLVGGIIEALPELIDATITLVFTLIEKIIENLPKIIAAGIKILIALAEGLIKAIPQLISAVFVIIVTLVEELIKSIPKLVQAGIDLLLAFIEGLLDTLGEIGKAALEIGEELLTGIGDFATDMIEIGKDLIEGLAKGIKEMAGRAIDAAKEVASNIWGSVKGFFGIKSPSRLFRYGIGQMLGEGLVLGMQDELSSIAKMAEKVSEAATPEQPKLAGLDVGDFRGHAHQMSAQLQANLTGTPTTGTTNEININIEGNWSIREEADIERVANELGRLMDQKSRQNGLVARGGW